MSFLYRPGDLAQTPLAAILLEALNLHATGVFVVEHGGGASKLYLRDGVLVGAQVCVGFQPLGRYLLAEGLIAFDTLEKSLQEMARTGRPQGQLLVEMGAISPAALDRALSEQQAKYLLIIAALESGRYRFDASSPVPEWTQGVRLSPFKVIVDALEKPQAEAFVNSALRPVAQTPLILSPGYRQTANSFGWNTYEAALVGQLERPTALETFFSDDSRVPPERARAALTALLLLGYAEPSLVDVQREPGMVIEAAIAPDDLLQPIASDPSVFEATEAAQVATPVEGGTSRPMTAASRSDPVEARARRQRLLAKAMQNMGIGPLSSRPTSPPAPAATPLTSTSTAVATQETRETNGPGAKPSPAEAELRRALAEVAPRAATKDLFKRLGLDRSASQMQVKQAYLALAKQFHPDRFLGAAQSDLALQVKNFFAAMNEAYEILSDEKKRAAYLVNSQNAGAEGPSREAQLDFKKGEACLKSRDFTRARGFYEAAIRQDSRPEYQAALAWCWFMDPVQQDREKAKDLIAEALKDTQCDRAHYIAGILARDEGDEERAERMFRAAFRANPRHLEAEREIRLIEMRRQKKSGGSIHRKGNP